MTNPSPNDIEAVEIIGWIKPLRKDFDVEQCRKQLTDCGVEVGAWDMFEREFMDCKATAVAMDKLDDLWGDYAWGME